MYAGIDVGGTNIKGVLSDSNGNILNFIKIPTEQNAADIENGICSIVEKFSAIKSGKYGKVKAIGIGAAGSIDKKAGIILTSANIQSWKKYPIVSIIEKRLGISTFLENDAAAAVIGEQWKGNGRHFKNWIMLTLGTGIGGGIVIDNKLYTGRSGSSAEFGHTTIDYKGKRCPCGNIGCLELYASATALVRSAKSKIKKHLDSSINIRLSQEKLTSRLIFEEALKGDTFAVNIIHEIAIFLGIGISNLISIFNPEAVIIGGGLSRAHKFILPAVKKVVQERVQEGLKENIRYLVVKDEEKTPALGAAKVAINGLN
jgi:glucokinase